jgi:membrane protein YqaA with SNARE-associated domain
VILHYLFLVAVVFGVNLLPAFGPPTWAVLVFFRLHYDLNSVATIALGAVAAASGRFLLAQGARFVRPRLSADRRKSLEALQKALSANRFRSVLAVALFALSPVPSAQLFLAAGLMEMNLPVLTAAFFAGRLVSYSLFVGAASGADGEFGPLVEDWLTSPVAIGLEVLMVVGLVLLVRVDWAKVISRRLRKAQAKKGKGRKTAAAAR